jgi:hypothetical protein
MPSLAPVAFVKVAYRCWERDPAARGTFAEAVRDLEPPGGEVRVLTGNFE